MFKLMKNIGEGTIYTGMAGLFVMAIVGSISIDIVILAAMVKESKRNHGHNNNNSFITGFLWGQMFSNNHSRNNSVYNDAGIMLLASPFITAIAVALSFYLGVPTIGIALMAGWAASAAVVVAGVGLYALTEGLEMMYERSKRNQVPPAGGSAAEPKYSSSYAYTQSACPTPSAPMASASYVEREATFVYGTPVSSNASSFMYDKNVPTATPVDEKNYQNTYGL